MPTRRKVQKMKQALYFPDEMLAELRRQAERLDRPLSWVVERAWKLALRQIKDLPSVPESIASTSRRWKSVEERDE